MKDRTEAIHVFLVTGIIAFFLMFWITETGPGVSPDSVKYLKAAANLIEGRDIVTPVNP